MLYKKLRARFPKFYQALFTVKKQGYTIESTGKKLYIKMLLRKHFCEKRKIFSQYSIPVKSSRLYLLPKEVLATTYCLNSAYCRDLAFTWYSIFYG